MLLNFQIDGGLGLDLDVDLDLDVGLGLAASRQNEAQPCPGADVHSMLTS